VKTNHPLCCATWVWPGDFYQMHNTYAQFRRDFRLARVPGRAPFHITADQCYVLYVNGRYVGRGPARGFQAAWRRSKKGVDVTLALPRAVEADVRLPGVRSAGVTGRNRWRVT